MKMYTYTIPVHKAKLKKNFLTTSTTSPPPPPTLFATVKWGSFGRLFNNFPYSLKQTLPFPNV